MRRYRHRLDGGEGDALVRSLLAGDPEGHFRHELDDVLEALYIDLVDVVRGPVVVLVGVGEEVQDRDPLSIERGVIRGAEPVRRSSDTQGALQRSVGVAEDLFPLLRGAHAHDGECAALQATHHVHVQHCDRSLDGDEGIPHIVR